MGGHARRWLGPSACPRLPRARCLSQAGQSAHGGSRRSRPPAGRPPEPGRGRRALGCWSGLPAQGTSGAWAGSSWPRSPMLPLRDSERGPPGSPRHQHPQRHSLAFRPALAVTSSVAGMPLRPAGSQSSWVTRPGAQGWRGQGGPPGAGQPRRPAWRASVPGGAQAVCAGRPPPPAAVPAGSVPLVPGTRGSSSILARGEQGEAGRTVGPGQSFQYRVVRTATSEAPRPLWLSGLVSEGGDGRLLSRGGRPTRPQAAQGVRSGPGQLGVGGSPGWGPRCPARSVKARRVSTRPPAQAREEADVLGRGAWGARQPRGAGRQPPERWARGQGVGVGR